jgi:hypothetical protein
MNFYSYTIITITFFIIVFVTIKLLRKKIDFNRTLNLTFLKITLPKKDSDLDEKQETLKDFKEAISIMEQLFSSLKSIYS